MAPRRPSTAGDIDSRMPFASAEALLWGPEMKQQHAHLLTEMRVLQKCHEAYDARIRTAEHATEAAEAATSRIRHLEQQLAAIEAEDEDKAFENWAVGEMTRLGIFVDTNKHVRQKQIELENVMSHAVEDLDKLKQVPEDLQGVLRRLDLLEAGRNQDTRRIKSLEKEVTHLKAIRQHPTTNTAGPQTVSRPQKGIIRSRTPSQLLNDELSDATTEIEDEDLIPMHNTIHEAIQVPQSPEMQENKTPNTISASSQNIGSPVKSARQRLMQRPSIHDSMLPPVVEEQRKFRTHIPLPSNVQYAAPVETQLLHHNRQSRAPAPNTTRETHSITRVSPPPTQLLHNDGLYPAPASTRKARPRARGAPPPTQLVDKASPRKRKLPEKGPQTQRLTRAQVKRSQAQEAEEQKPLITGSSTTSSFTQMGEPVASSRKKQKTAHVREPDQVKAKSRIATRMARRAPVTSTRSAAVDLTKNMATEPTQLVTRSPAKPYTSKSYTSPLKKENPLPVSPDAQNPRKQKSLIVILRSPQKGTMTEHIESDDIQATAADRVRMSPRKAAAVSLSRLNAISKPPSVRKTAGKTKPAAGVSKSGGRPRMKLEISGPDAS